MKLETADGHFLKRCKILAKSKNFRFSSLGIGREQSGAGLSFTGRFWVSNVRKRLCLGGYRFEYITAVKTGWISCTGFIH